MKNKSLINLFLTFLFIINFLVLSVKSTTSNTTYTSGSSSTYVVSPLTTILGISYVLILLGVPIIILARVILIITRSKGNDNRKVSSIVCSNCGSKILSNDTFCENCGKELVIQK